MRFSSTGWIVVLLAVFPLSITGCVGTMEAVGGRGDQDDQTDGGATHPPKSACKVPDRALPQTRAWRLSPRQYANTLEQTFGFQEPALLPVEVPVGQGYAVFDTGDSGKQVTTEHFNAFHDTAVRVARSLLPEIERDHACALDGDNEGCAVAFIEAYGRRAFRRPVTPEETTLYLDHFTKASVRFGARDAARLILEAMLQSPRHLYRTEMGVEAGDRIALTPFEIAAQLSYMIADGPPDEDLMRAAEDGRLDDPDEVHRHAERLIQTPSARFKVRDFFMQLFKVDGLATGAVPKDAEKFPQYTVELRDAMVREAELFIENVVFDAGGDLRTLHNANFSYVNAALAEIYGMDASRLGDEFERVELPPERRGILSQPAFLTLTSPPDHTSPAMRGITLWTKLLCRPVPMPPPGAADNASKVFSPEPELTQREHWEFARDNAPECAGCHGLFVPMGLGLEQFDAIGRYRRHEYGKTIDTSVDMGDFAGVEGRHDDALQVVSRLIESDEGRRCFAIQLQSFATGREIDVEGASCEIDALADHLKNNDHQVQSLVLALTQVDSFYNRRTGE